MFCKNCGREIGNAEICPKCNTRNPDYQGKEEKVPEYLEDLSGLFGGSGTQKVVKEKVVIHRGVPSGKVVCIAILFMVLGATTGIMGAFIYGKTAQKNAITKTDLNLVVSDIGEMQTAIDQIKTKVDDGTQTSNIENNNLSQNENENWEDTNGDGVLEESECWEDTNGNGDWDESEPWKDINKNGTLD